MDRSCMMCGAYVGDDKSGECRRRRPEAHVKSAVGVPADYWCCEFFPAGNNTVEERMLAALETLVKEAAE